MSNKLIVGAIQNTHALKGELKIKVLSDINRFVKGNTLYIEYKDGFIKVEVLTVREHEKCLLVKFKGLEDINLVEKYKGQLIWINKDDVSPLEEDEYYFHELIGLDIYNQKGEKRGIVTEIREVPQGHLLVVNVNEKSKLIPFRKEFVTKVDKDKIVINEIEGLL